MTAFSLAIDCRNTVGESPVWDDRRQCLWWTDIMAKVLFRLDWPGSTVVSTAMPQRLASLGLCDSGRLVLGFEDGVYLHEPGSECFDCLAVIEADIPRNRLNDGKVGPDGAFWIGSMDESQPRQPTASLYRVAMESTAGTSATKASVTRVFDDVIVSNGLAWSNDGSIMLHADSRRSVINAWNFDCKTGALSGKRKVATPDAQTGRPDGAACDMQGQYWSAGVSSGTLNCWSLDGTLLRTEPMPTPHPTMPCFGGADLRTVFVTSLRSAGPDTDLERWPYSGGLFVADLGVVGVPIARFKDQ